MQYFCCDEQRRIALKGHPTLNGIDFLEVVDNIGDPIEQRQTTLLLHFINPLAPGSLQVSNIVIEGGERVDDVKVISIQYGLASPPTSPIASTPNYDPERVLVITVDKAGDFSIYTLRLVQDAKHSDAPTGFDPILSSIEFSFKVLCPSEFDCKENCGCVTEVEAAPEINYLAKDYASFRQLMLDRMALLVPDWRERNLADLGIVLVELLAYAGDYLSYRQDAISTEAYMGTARRRTSLRRHARLVDYFMHDGCNARTWLHIELNEGFTNVPLTTEHNGAKTKVLTRGIDIPTIFRDDVKYFEIAQEQQLQIFELMHDLTLDYRHNTMNFYTWLQDECCLPKGAVSATLDGHFPALMPGHVLIFAEVAGPITGIAGDADPLHRHPVRLTSVELSGDPLGNVLQSPGDFNERPVTKITWHDADALPFPLCISSTSETGKSVVVSVAYGNNVLTDHGFTDSEVLPAVPKTDSESPLNIVDSSGCTCEKPTLEAIPSRYRPTLQRRPLTQAAPYKDKEKKKRNDKKEQLASAASLCTWTMRDPLPAIFLSQQSVPGKWQPQRDLLNSKHNDEHFVVEIESNHVANLRFGNDSEGQRPEPETVFTATYRTGNGKAGNVGAETLSHLVSNAPEITGDKIKSIWNPLPAVGGMEQESMQSVRMRAPIAFRSQERAVTLADYEDVSKRCSTEVQRSAGSLRWTGSWRTVFLTVDRIGGKKITEQFETDLRNCIEKYRMAGQDLEVDGPLFVSLEIEITICVNQHYFKNDVKKALLQVFSNKLLSDGTRGIFHPDNFSFGQTVYLSPLYAAAQKVPGVDSVKITKFQRQGINDILAMSEGKMLFARLEIARLDNDPNFPEHGVLKFNMQGGK